MFHATAKALRNAAEQRNDGSASGEILLTARVEDVELFGTDELIEEIDITAAPGMLTAADRPVSVEVTVENTGTEAITPGGVDLLVEVEQQVGALERLLGLACGYSYVRRLKGLAALALGRVQDRLV